MSETCSKPSLPKKPSLPILRAVLVALTPTLTLAVTLTLTLYVLQESSRVEFGGGKDNGKTQTMVMLITEKEGTVTFCAGALLVTGDPDEEKLYDVVYAAASYLTENTGRKEMFLEAIPKKYPEDLKLSSLEFDEVHKYYHTTLIVSE